MQRVRITFTHLYVWFCVYAFARIHTNLYTFVLNRPYFWVKSNVHIRVRFFFPLPICAQWGKRYTQIRTFEKFLTFTKKFGVREVRYVHSLSSPVVRSLIYDSLWHIHCGKSVSIRSYSGPYFPVFELNTERYGVENTEQKKLPIWALFTQCTCHKPNWNKSIIIVCMFMADGILI